MGHTNVAASAIRNAIAAQEAYAKTGEIQRGAFAVRAQAGTPEIKAVIEGVAARFNEFKSSQEQRLTQLETDSKDSQAAIDKMVVQLAGQAGNPKALAADTDEKQSVQASVGLRGHKIGAYFKARAMHDAGGGMGVLNDVQIGEFARGLAGFGCSDGVKAALSQGQSSTGGVAVPNIVMPEILDAMVDQSSLLAAGASILPIDTGAKTVTVAAMDQLPTVGWRQELGNVAESEPTFRPVTATPRSAACIVRISRELLADAADLDRALIQAISSAFALELDRIGLVGSGTAPEPLGIYGMAGVKKIQAGPKFNYASILAAYQSQLEGSAGAPTSVILAPRTLIGLAGLTDTLGQPLNAPAVLAGVRQLSTNAVPVNLGDSGDKSLAFVGDFSTVAFALREGLTMARLSEAYCKTGEIGFLCHMRVDVIANYPKALTVIEGVAG